MLQNAGVLNILTCKCASRHSGVQFFDIKPPKSGPYPSVFPHFDLQMCFAPQPRAKSGTQNWLRTCGVLCILTWKCASRHSRVPFLNIGTSKMAPRMWCFVHFDLNMCFAPQRRAIFNIGTSKMAPRMWCFVHFDLNMCFAPQPRAIFQHRNFQNGSANVVFCAFWLANVLRATAACHFSPVCQNSYLRTRRFSEPTFRTSGTTNHWKNTAIRDVPNIFRACTFFLVTLHACGSPFCWLDISTLLDTSTLLFNSAYCRKLDF